ncbi:MAG: hypothetical protein U0441_11660 [Polyangiaceae bacterium]
MRKGSILLAGLLFAGALPACQPEPVKGPNPTRTLDERRAIEIIRNAIAAEGQRPAAGRDDVVAGTEKNIHIDVSVDGHKFGVVYVSDDDLASLGAAIQPPNQKDEKLHLARAGKDGDVRILLVYQTNYRYDDLVGEDHEQTAITCENQLTKDVRDFITHALTHKFE